MKHLFYYLTNIPTRCENCGRPIRNVYYVDCDGFIFKCGSECIKHYLTISDKGEKFIKKHMKDVMKYLDKKKKLSKMLEEYEAGKLDIEEIKDFIRDYRNDETVIKEAYDWIRVYQMRADDITRKMNEKLNLAKITVREKYKNMINENSTAI